jgi:16S rRNA (cytidine1402-2'-O)-methyltransferase
MFSKGKLILIPSAVGHENREAEIPSFNTSVVSAIKHFVVENERSARRFLKWLNREIDIDQLTFYPMGKHAESDEADKWVNAALSGLDVGVLSDAGCPGVADPGGQVTSLAHRKGIEVVPLVGPSSLLLALMSSGFNGQDFSFKGYLPHDASERKRVILQMEKDAEKGSTRMFMETPFRNDKLLDELIKTLAPNTHLCVARALLTTSSSVRVKSIAQWNKARPTLGKEPCVFLIGKPL